MAFTITSGDNDKYWTLEEMSENIEFRNDPAETTGVKLNRQYRHHATVVVSRIFGNLFNVTLDGTLSEASGGLLGPSELDVDACTGVRDAGSTKLWNLITGALGCVYDSDSYAKMTLISDSIFPEADYSYQMRRVQEWDAVSNWKEYTQDA